MASTILLLITLFFAGNAVFGLVGGHMIAKGGVNSPTPLVRILDRDQDGATFWGVFILYCGITVIFGGISAEIAGFVDVPWFTPEGA